MGEVNLRNSVLQGIKRWREKYYPSLFLSSVARPFFLAARLVEEQIRRKVRKNGVSLALPNGRRLNLARNAGVSFASGLYWNGFENYEPATSRTLRFFFERVSTFVDVGANIGFYSLLAGHWNPGLRVLAFEPVPEIFAQLEANIRANGLEGRVTAYELALSDATGSATFYLPPSDATADCEMTGTLVDDGWQHRKQSPQIEVRTSRFDDLEREHPVKVDLIKIDVEDFEAAALLGMQATIQRDRPFIVCEILPREHGNRETLKVIQSFGYTPYWITPSGYIKVSRLDFDRRGALDFLLSPVASNMEVVDDVEKLWNLYGEQFSSPQIAKAAI
jgi:FkbM family methyltransferase